MTRKLPLLGGIAGAALFAAGLASGPALAQSDMPASNNPPPSYSSNTAANPSSETSTMGTQTGHSAMATSENKIALADVTDTTKLQSAAVQDKSGQQIGQVQKVNTGSNGKPESVDVALNTPSSQGKVVKIRASKLKFDSASNAIVADMSESQVNELPQTSGGQ